MTVGSGPARIARSHSFRSSDLAMPVSWENRDSYYTVNGWMNEHNAPKRILCLTASYSSPETGAGGLIMVFISHVHE